MKKSCLKKMTKKEKEMHDTLDNDKKEQLKNMMKGEENKRVITFLMKRNNS